MLPQITGDARFGKSVSGNAAIAVGDGNPEGGIRIDPTSLALFVAVVEEGTIAAAARREHIAAAAVSTRISELEEALGARLLSRTNKGVFPTAAGHALLGLSRGVLHSLDELALEIGEYSTGLRGHVRVFANISAIAQWLPNEIHSFLAAHPAVRILLEETISASITRAVADNAADVGIFTPGPYGGDLETFPYHHDRLVLIVPRRHPLARRRSVAFADTLAYDFVGLHTGSAINLQLFKAASERDGTLRLRIQVTSYDALCRMVGAGLGIGILPAAVAGPFEGALGLKVMRLDEPWARRELRIGVRSFATLPVAAQRFVEHLRSQVKSTASGGRP